jgi:hypothetical protein
VGCFVLIFLFKWCFFFEPFKGDNADAKQNFTYTPDVGKANVERGAAQGKFTNLPVVGFFLNISQGKY